MNWIEALKTCNANHGGKWHIPKRGTKEHKMVHDIMTGNMAVLAYCNI